MTPEPGSRRMVVLSAPSGAGKTSIARRLVEGSPDFVFSVSVTTRRRRPGERDGDDYAFVSREEFDRMRAAGELVEWAEVHGSLYGTPRSALTAKASLGRHVVLDIDVQGAGQIRTLVPEALQIFVLPPSAETLVQRLVARGTEDRVELHRRLRTARKELRAAHDFDYVVVNDDLTGTVQLVMDLVRSGEAYDSDAWKATLKEVATGIDVIIERDYADVPLG